MSLTFDNGYDNQYFQLPKEIIKYLAGCSLTDLKVIIALFEVADSGFDAVQICSTCAISQTEFEDSVVFWVRSGVIAKRGSALSFKKGTLTKVSVGRDMPKYESKDIEMATEKAPELSYVFEQVSQLMGTTLNSIATESIFGMYDWLGLPPDVIIMLFRYCISSGKKSMRYIETCAKDWSQRGLVTHEQVEAHIIELEKSQVQKEKIKSSFGITQRALTTKEEENIDRWTKEWGFSIDMIKLAYDRGVDKTGKLSFSYINGILNSWFNNKLKTPQDLLSDVKSGNHKISDRVDLDEVLVAAIRSLNKMDNDDESSQ